MIKTFTTTPKIIMGQGAVDAVGAEIASRNVKRALIVTDEGVIKAKLLAGIEASLKAAKVGYTVYSGVEPDPRYEIVAECVKAARKAGAEMLIGVGGGSSMDIAKASSIMLTNEGPIGNYFGVNLVPAPGLPIILIPTTAGTGSEVTPIAILSDEDEKLKKGIVSTHLYPATAILDPVLTAGLPPHITAATGMDALIHGIEAFTSVNATGITDMFCLRAIRLIYRNIRIACAKGDHLEARAAMMEGAMLAGIGFANAGVTAVHAFAYPIGAEYHIPHGVANTLMLLPVMRYNVLGNYPKFARLAKPFGISNAGLDEIETVERVMTAIDRLAGDIHVPRHLAEFGVKEKDVPVLAEGALKSTRLLVNNPRNLTLEDAKKIYLAAL